MRQRLRAKLKEVRAELRRRRDDPIPAVGAWLRSVVDGHFRYYGVSGNIQALKGFRYEVTDLAMGPKASQPESQGDLGAHDAPGEAVAATGTIYHPYPSLSTAVTTQGKSPVP